jgi:UDP-GlcNAc:undecaprenyl-phosphate GlcNAc-1-phosphate transferase
MLLPFAIAFLVSVCLTPVVIFLARKMDWVVQPRDDRWHKKPTAVYGGVGIFVAFLVAFLTTGSYAREFWVLAGSAGLLFLLGLLDDTREMKPQVKFLAQLLVALLAVSQGVSLDSSLIPWAWLEIPLAVLWLVGITNAVNILDNMDGLSSGVVFISSLVLALGAWLSGCTDGVCSLAAVLAGAALGFFIYNFNPAKIFMGDCGSLFLGFTLAGLALLSTGTTAHASQTAFAVLVPLGALVVPIFDTTLVSFQRSTHGRSIAQGGRDHSSHRLVFLGLSKRKAVLLLLAISALGGFIILLLSRYATILTAIVVLVLLLVGLLFFGVYLGEVKVYDSARKKLRKGAVLSGLVMHKKQLLQIVADLLLLSAAYTASWLLRFDGVLVPGEMKILAKSLPILLAIKMACFWFFGLYRGQWRYLSVYDIIQIIKACFLGSLIHVLALVILFRFEGYSRAVMIIDMLLAFVFVAGARSLIRVFREKVRGVTGIPVLIMGAGDGGELLLRELHNNPNLKYIPVGFVDDDPSKQGSVIHGIHVLGDRDAIPALIKKHNVERVFISILSSKKHNFDDVFDVCKELGIPCTRIQPMIKL